MINQTILKTEKSYPPRQVLPDAQTSWEVENPEYRPAIVPDFDTTRQRLEDKGVVMTSAAELTVAGALSNRQAVEAYGEAILSLRHPLGRTGLTGTGGFWRAGNSATADFALGRMGADGLEMALVYNRDRWSLPGGFLEPDEDLHDRTEAGIRECCEETGLDLHPVAHLARPMTEVHIKPRSKRSLDFAFISNQVIGLLLPTDAIDEKLHASDDAEAAGWFDLPTIASMTVSVDHREYIQRAAQRFTTAC